jgi:hypothetical protein
MGGESSDLITHTLGGGDSYLINYTLVGVEVESKTSVVLLDDSACTFLYGLGTNSLMLTLQTKDVCEKMKEKRLVALSCSVVHSRVVCAPHDNLECRLLCSTMIPALTFQLHKMTLRFIH